MTTTKDQFIDESVLEGLSKEELDELSEYLDPDVGICTLVYVEDSKWRL